MGKWPKNRLSVCIICHNEEKNIGRCLESCDGVHEIIVVDSMSTDGTLKIAEKFTDRIFQRKWSGYVAQKNHALSKATGDWVLSLDADEAVSAGLQREISLEMENPNASDGYRMPRLSFYLGRWIRHSGYYPDRQLRLFKREKGYWVGERVHERVEIDGRVGELKKDLLHFPYGGVISGQIATINRFSTLLAEEMHARGKKFHIPLLLFRPVFKFLEVYFLKRGLMDGMAGFVIAVSDAYAMFVRYVKLMEMRRQQSVTRKAAKTRRV